MVNTVLAARPVHTVSRLIAAYVGVVVATIVVLALLAATRPDHATDDACIHAAIVAVFAVLLPLRWRAAKRGSVRAVLVVGGVAAVLVVVNLVEAAIPGLFPGWMRVEMIGLAVLLAALAIATARARRAS